MDSKEAVFIRSVKRDAIDTVIARFTSMGEFDPEMVKRAAVDLAQPSLDEGMRLVRMGGRQLSADEFRSVIVKVLYDTVGNYLRNQIPDEMRGGVLKTELDDVRKSMTGKRTIGSAGPASAGPSLTPTPTKFPLPMIKTITVTSAFRDRTSTGSPGMFRYYIDPEFTIKGCNKVELLLVSMPPSFRFYETPERNDFFLQVKGFTDEYSRQNDASGIRAQFTCHAIVDTMRDMAEIMLPNPEVRFPTPITLSDYLEFRLLDKFKSPLQLEQDIYNIISVAWDNVRQTLLINLPQHYIRGADTVQLFGVICEGDAELFLKQYQAIVLSPTQIMIEAWRAGSPTLTITSPALVVWPNSVTYTMKFSYDPALSGGFRGV
jgi:hypothetical protein